MLDFFRASQWRCRDHRQMVRVPKVELELRLKLRKRMMGDVADEDDGTVLG